MDTVDSKQTLLLDNTYLALARDNTLWEAKPQFFLRILSETICHTLQVDRFSVYLLNESKSQLKQIQLYTKSTTTHSSGSVLKKEDYPNYFNALINCRIIDASDAYTDPRTSEFSDNYLRPLGIGAMLDTTLYKAGEMRGMICAEHIGGSRTWTESEALFLLSIGDLISQRLLYEKLKNKKNYFSELNALHEAIINSSNNLIITLDLDGKIQATNASTCNLLDYTQKDLLYQDFCSFLLSNKDSTLQLNGSSNTESSSITIDFESLKNAVNKGQTGNFETLMISKNSVNIPVSCSVNTFKDNKGEIAGYVCTATDIRNRVKARTALNTEQQRYRFIFENSGDGIILIENGIFIDCNQTTLDIFKCTRDQFIGQTPQVISPFVQDDGIESSVKANNLLSATIGGQAQHFEWTIKRFDGELFTVDAVLNKVTYKGKAVVLAHIRDITKRKIAEQELLLSNLKIDEHAENLKLINQLSQEVLGLDSVDEIYQTTINTLNGTHLSPNVAIYTVDSEANMLNFKMHSGYNQQAIDDNLSFELTPEVGGKTLETGNLVYLSDLNKFNALAPEHVAGFLKYGSQSVALVPLVYLDQKIALLILAYSEVDALSEENINTLNSIGKSVSLALLNAKRRSDLEYSAHHDSLTGLSNRDYFHKQFKKIILKSGQKNAALFLLDLDNFKEINDSLGHFTGDKVLQKIARRLNGVISDREFLVGRLGGDEFILLVNGIKNTAEAQDVGQSILDCFKQSLKIGDLNLLVDASIGIAMYPNDGMDSHSLLRSADVAMYQAKKTGSCFSVYDAQQDIHTPERLVMIAEIGNSISNGQVYLHYQPKVDLNSKKVLGFEALVRWNHPRLGELSPGMFIPLIEMTNSIHLLTEEVLNQAMAQQQQWIESGFNYTVAVNLSARNLIDDTIIALLKNLLERYNTPPEMLELEITETALMHDPVKAIDLLRQIANLGIQLSIDDFGTGYSSLSYLRTLPIHKLKLDRQFIMDMFNNEEGTSIVQSIIKLSNTLDLTVIAEGVEDQATLTQLRVMNCDQAQGYYICRPNTWDNIQRWLKDGSSF